MRRGRVHEQRTHSKFAPPPTPLQQEQSLKQIVPRENWQVGRLKDIIDRELAKTPSPARKNALEFWRMQLEQDDATSEVTQKFTKGFWCWLLGRGTEEEHKRTLWGRSNVAVRNSEVAAYVDEMVRKKTEYTMQLVLMANRVPVTLNGYYLYYKYIVQGKLRHVLDGVNDSYYVDDDDFLQDWDVFQREHRAYSGFIKPSATHDGQAFSSNEPYPYTPDQKADEACSGGSDDDDDDDDNDAGPRSKRAPALTRKPPPHTGATDTEADDDDDPKQPPAPLKARQQTVSATRQKRTPTNVEVQSYVDPKDRPPMRVLRTPSPERPAVPVPPVKPAPRPASPEAVVVPVAPVPRRPTPRRVVRTPSPEPVIVPAPAPRRVPVSPRRATPELVTPPPEPVPSEDEKDVVQPRPRVMTGADAERLHEVLPRGGQRDEIKELLKRHRDEESEGLEHLRRNLQDVTRPAFPVEAADPLVNADRHYVDQHRINQVRGLRDDKLEDYFVNHPEEAGPLHYRAHLTGGELRRRSAATVQMVPGHGRMPDEERMWYEQQQQAVLGHNRRLQEQLASAQRVNEQMLAAGQQLEAERAQHASQLEFASRQHFLLKQHLDKMLAAGNAQAAELEEARQNVALLARQRDHLQRQIRDSSEQIQKAQEKAQKAEAEAAKTQQLLQSRTTAEQQQEADIQQHKATKRTLRQNLPDGGKDSAFLSQQQLDDIAQQNLAKHQIRQGKLAIAKALAEQNRLAEERERHAQAEAAARRAQAEAEEAQNRLAAKELADAERQRALDSQQKAFEEQVKEHRKQMAALAATSARAQSEQERKNLEEEQRRLEAEQAERQRVHEQQQEAEAAAKREREAQDKAQELAYNNRLAEAARAEEQRREQERLDAEEAERAEKEAEKEEEEKQNKKRNPDGSVSKAAAASKVKPPKGKVQKREQPPRAAKTGQSMAGMQANSSLKAQAKAARVRKAKKAVKAKYSKTDAEQALQQVREAREYVSSASDAEKRTHKQTELLQRINAVAQKVPADTEEQAERRERVKRPLQVELDPHEAAKQERLHIEQRHEAEQLVGGILANTDLPPHERQQAELIAERLKNGDLDDQMSDVVHRLRQMHHHMVHGAMHTDDGDTEDETLAPPHKPRKRRT